MVSCPIQNGGWFSIESLWLFTKRVRLKNHSSVVVPQDPAGRGNRKFKMDLCAYHLSGRCDSCPETAGVNGSFPVENSPLIDDFDIESW